MFFHIKWASKNLISNKRRSLKKILSIATSLYIVILCCAIINGASSQMEDSIYYSVGDVRVDSRLPEYNLNEINSDLLEQLGEDFTIFKQFNNTGQISGPGGYSNVYLSGTETDFLPFLSQSIGWEIEPSSSLKRGTVILEANLAESIKAKKGDYITLKIVDEYDMINTIQLEVDGVFLGNPYLYEEYAILNIEDARELFFNDFGLNRIMAFSNKKFDVKYLRETIDHLSVKYHTKATFSVGDDADDYFVFMVFSYYRTGMITMLSLVILIFIIILYFSLKNIYFIEFRARRQELATLLTFGMKPITINIVIFFETMFSFLLAAIFSYPILFLTGKVLSLFTITGISMQELVTMLGGNKVLLGYDSNNIVILTAVIFVISLIASRRGSAKYLTMNIREFLSLH